MGLPMRKMVDLSASFRGKKRTRHLPDCCPALMTMVNGWGVVLLTWPAGAEPGGGIGAFEMSNGDRGAA
jgi:hypothetical protein